MTKLNQNANILALDIETSPAKVYAWRMFDNNVSHDQIIDPGSTICVGAKWVGHSEVYLFSDWEHGHKEMLENIHAMISAADAVLTYNGDRFDLPKLNGQFLLNGLPPMPPVTSIDCLKAVKKLGYDMNRLAFIGPFLGLGKKLKHEGFMLWSKVMDGDPRAQARMGKYCRQDVILLEKLYLKIRPFIKTHPFLGRTKSTSCGACGSDKVQSRGVRRTKGFIIQRLHCQACGSWSDGKRSKV